MLNPSVVVLGGFLATIADQRPRRHSPPPSRAQAMPANMEGLDIRVASLAEDRLLIGAAEAAFGRLLADPAGAAG